MPSLGQPTRIPRLNPLQAKQRVLALLSHARTTEAAQLAARLCSRYPDDPQCWALRGSAFERLGQLGEAGKAYRKALALHPGYYEALYNLGCLSLDAGREREASELFRRAVQARPDSAAAHINLGVIARRQGEAETARRHFRRATGLEPRNPLAWYNLGNALMDTERYEEAAACYQRATELDPAHADAFFNLGNACRQLFLRAEAVRHYERAISLRPDHGAARFALADVLLLLGRHEEAIRHFDDLVEAAPEDIEALAGKAEALEKAGRTDQAYELLRPCMASHPPSARLALVFASLCHRFDACDEALAWIDHLVAAGELPAGDRASLRQAAGAILDRRGAYQEAFAQFREANRLKESLGGKSRHEEDMDASLAYFSGRAMVGLPHSSCTSDVPVFIVGMPRSGTSLVEQIIASHPQARGAGELPYINRFVASLPGLIGTEKAYPQCLEEADPALLDSLAADYLGHLRRHAPDAARIVDKLPHNFMWLGLIELLFPRARVIHCTRNPMDNCLSLYTTRGFNAYHSYAFDLEALGRHYLKYREMMAMWKQQLSLPVLDLQYEDLVSDFDAQVHRLIDFCGLPWDERCLRYHETGRRSTTLSYAQVRQPIYHTSVGRWRHYRDFLEPLETTLEQGTFRIHGDISSDT